MPCPCLVALDTGSQLSVKTAGPQPTAIPSLLDRLSLNGWREWRADLPGGRVSLDALRQTLPAYHAEDQEAAGYGTTRPAEQRTCAALHHPGKSPPQSIGFTRPGGKRSRGPVRMCATAPSAAAPAARVPSA